jgi:hypothetical protein
MKKNLILGTAMHYSFDVIRPFISTLNSTGYSGDVAIFYSDINERTLARLRRRDLILVPFQTSFPYLEPKLAKHILWADEPRVTTINVYSLRYLLAYCYLAEYGAQYHHVMLTDTRDVIFQKDPFDFSIDGKLCCFLEREGASLGGEATNAEWMELAFGRSILEKFYAKPIVCSGVSIGPSDLVIDYLKKLIDLFLAAPGEGWQIDQATHNYLIHDGQLAEIALHANNAGPVLTLGMEDSVLLDRFGSIINTRGDIPNVVHQYDRHWHVAKRFYSLRFIWKHYQDRLSRMDHRARVRVSRTLRTYAPPLHSLLVRLRKILSRIRNTKLT